MRRPAPTVKTSASTSSPTTRPRYIRRAPRPCDSRAESLSVRPIVLRAASNAGAVPHTSVTTTLTISVKASTGPSTPTWPRRAIDDGSRLDSARVAPTASPTPAMADASAMTALSTSNCCTIASGWAPIAVRTANSWRRLHARPNMRFVTLAQPMRSTAHTAPKRIRIGRRTLPTRSSRSGRTVIPSPPSSLACSCLSCAAIGPASRRAASRETPSRSRPTTESMCTSRRSMYVPSTESGSSASTLASGKT